MKICIEIELYLQKSEYICEKRNISPKSSYISEKPNISTKSQLYLRKSIYISENANYLIKVRIVSSTPSLYGVLGMGPMRFSYFSPSRMNPSLVKYMISTTSFMKGLNKPSI